ncbi:MAG: DUF4277 domain-containing protein, partial [Microcystaceae cyanobacterium]
MSNNQTEPVDIRSERVDDIPVIMEWLKQMEIAKWIDRKLKQLHGNHQGMSYGQLSVVLLTYIITQADHRLCAVEAWVNTHRQTLERVTGWAIGEKDVTDDRLARVVEELGQQQEACQQIELKVGQHLIRAYQLPTEVGRADSSSFSVHHEQVESEAENLLLGHKQFVFLADCKAAAIATRAQIAGQGGIYCFPLPMSGQTPLLLKQWVLDPPAASVEIRLPQQDADAPSVGQGFEVELGKFWLQPTPQKWRHWHERHLVIYSSSLATAQKRGLHQRLDQAQAALTKLAAKPGYELE